MRFNKKLKYSVITLFTSAVFSLNSCSIDVVPQDRYSDAAIFSDPAAMELYVNGLYAEFKKFQFGQFPNLGYDNAQDALADGMKFTSTVSGNGTVNLFISNANQYSATSVGLNYWASGYERIRRVNEFIDGVKFKSVVNDAEKVKYEAEARFIRAYAYSWLAKIHGSVIIQDDIKTYSEKDKQRSSEEAVYDFIISDLKYAAENLPVNTLSGRADKGAAYALLSRVALFAGSIAKNDQKLYNVDELTGISAARAKEYYKISADAAQAVINLGKYDLETNFATIFTDKNTKEAIFRVDYSFPSLVHQYDYGYAPPRDNNGNTLVYGVPTANLVDEFEMADGSKFSWTNATHAADPYVNREPRFYATILYNGASWKGRVMNTTVSDPVEGFISYGAEPEPKRTVTGYYAKKFLDPKNTNILVNRSTQSWIELRLGEVYLNLAEAQIGLEDYTGAVNTLTFLRSKRGLTGVNFNTNATGMAAIEHERIVELAFEGHRFWDLRRWRKAHIVLNGVRVSGTKIETQAGKFVYEKVPADNIDRSFTTRLYYLPIPADELLKNLGLTQIHGWENN